ncbi:MAG: glycosyltransferase family 2 protein [Acidobacteria bacterium]|nr:glycosyltransferase family 2 protein [Acidobacteriota bacterium]
MNTVLIIPALDEEESIGAVLDEIPLGVYSQVFVVDNGSMDRTAEVAAERGATVLSEPRRGYGHACLRAMAALPEDTEIVVFMDGDGSDDPAEADLLIEPIERGEADFVVGSRELGTAEPGSLSPHQRFGNRLVTWLARVLCSAPYTDLGPFRAIRAESLRGLRMRDPNYGWTVEMQMKAWRNGLRVQEAPVRYRLRRRGASKVSGSVTGSIRAGVKILWVFFRIVLTGPRRRYR